MLVVRGDQTLPLGSVLLAVRLRLRERSSLIGLFIPTILSLGGVIPGSTCDAAQGRLLAVSCGFPPAPSFRGSSPARVWEIEANVEKYDDSEGPCF